MKHCFCLLLLSAVTTTVANDGQSDFVQTIQSATVRIQSAGDRSSGIFVSPDGRVLTVAHGISANDSTVRLVTSDQRTLTAEVIAIDRNRDLAIVQASLSEAESTTFVSVSEVPAKVGDWVLAFGCPARETFSQPVARLGQITKTDDRFLLSTCRLTAGDSGGPLVNLQGNLVGLNARIGKTSQSNLHLDQKSFRDFTQKHLILSDALPTPIRFECRSNMATTAGDKALQLATTDGQPFAMATRINPTTIATKLSQLPLHGSIVCLPDRTPVKVTARNRQLDVAFLNLKQATKPSATAEPSVGSIVLSNGKRGIIGRIDHEEPSAKPVLGCSLVEKDQGIFVSEVNVNSTAGEAGLVRNDLLLVINGVSIRNFDHVVKSLTDFQPGDVVKFKIDRRGHRMTSRGRLRHLPSDLLDRAEFLNGFNVRRSGRRTGLRAVFQHDAQCTLAQIGSPVFDQQGRVIGMNIAVRSRESVLAIPIIDLQQLAIDR